MADPIYLPPTAIRRAPLVMPPVDQWVLVKCDLGWQPGKFDGRNWFLSLVRHDLMHSLKVELPDKRLKWIPMPEEA